LELRWELKLIMDGSKILSIVVEPMSLKSTPKSFDLTRRKGYYPHFFNTASKINYVGPNPEPEFYGADFMSATTFCSGTRNRQVRYFPPRQNCWPTVWMMLMY
jgi:hypothetical protein